MPGGLGSFRVATFAQSFHWMNRELVAATVREMLEPGGSWVHVGATTHEGVAGAHDLPGPEGTPSGEETILLAAGFSEPRRVTVAGCVHERSEDDIVASVFSLSSAAPHLFGERLHEFESDLRELLRRASPDHRFAERAREIELVIWAK